MKILRPDFPHAVLSSPRSIKQFFCGVGSYPFSLIYRRELVTSVYVYSATGGSLYSAAVVQEKSRNNRTWGATLVKVGLNAYMTARSLGTQDYSIL